MQKKPRLSRETISPALSVLDSLREAARKAALSSRAARCTQHAGHRHPSPNCLIHCEGHGNAWHTDWRCAHSYSGQILVWGHAGCLGRTARSAVYTCLTSRWCLQALRLVLGAQAAPLSTRICPGLASVDSLAARLGSVP